MTLLDSIREKARKAQKTIVLPETGDQRTIDAANFILDKGLAKLILIGAEDVSKKITAKDQSGLEIVHPDTCPDTARYIATYYELRKAKGTTPEEADKTIKTDWVSFGAMLVRDGKADGFVAGAAHTTADIIRAGLRCISIDKAIGVVSGAFIMEVPDSPYGEGGVFLFADCGVNPDPNARQLGGIAVSSAALFEQLVGKKARVAMLSYSTKGSAESPMIDKVREALRRAKEIAPDMLIDGELQPDAALVPDVARIKCPSSEIGGKANVLVFPDLNSGNICYKLTQRLAKARAVGPLLMGFQKPCSDLSRGCSWEDIVDAVAITAVRA